MNAFRWFCMAVLTLALLLMPARPCVAQCTETLPEIVLAVDGESEAQSPDGRSWECAYPTIQQALAVAEASAGEFTQVWVKADTYTLGSATDTVELVDGVWLLGGFAGTETLRTDADPDANPTILDGNGVATHVVSAENLYASLTRLDGFIITGGDADGEGTAAQGGGLLYIGDYPPTSRLNVTRCRFEDNHADDGGGAVAVIRPHDAPTQTTFEVTFTNCKFSENTAGNGGAVYIQGGPVYFNNSLFHDNEATGNGGAIFAALYCEQFDDCEIRLCPAQDGSEAVTNSCTFSQNHAGGQGGAVYLIKASILNATGSIFWGNTHSNGGTPVANRFATEDVCSVVSVTYSCIEGGHSGTGNTGGNPLFVNPGAGNFQIKSGSSAIDTGAVGLDFPDDLLDFDHDGDTNEELAPDLDRHERIIMYDIDMGAYERLCGCEGDTVTSATFAPPPDGQVDAADLAFLLGEWGANPDSPADIVT